MPSRQDLVQPFLAKVRSKADAGSVASGVIAPSRTISGSRLFGTLPSSLKMKVSVPSGALYCPGRPYAAARAIAASVQEDRKGNAQATVKVAAGELRLRGLGLSGRLGRAAHPISAAGCAYALFARFLPDFRRCWPRPMLF